MITPDDIFNDLVPLRKELETALSEEIKKGIELLIRGQSIRIPIVNPDGYSANYIKYLLRKNGYRCTETRENYFLVSIELLRN